MKSIQRFFRQKPRYNSKEKIIDFIDNFDDVISELLYLTNIDDYYFRDLQNKIKIAIDEDELDNLNELGISTLLSLILNFIKEKISEE